MQSKCIIVGAESAIHLYPRANYPSTEKEDTGKIFGLKKSNTFIYYHLYTMHRDLEAERLIVSQLDMIIAVESGAEQEQTVYQ